jgi:hypothetical protein
MVKYLKGTIGTLQKYTMNEYEYYEKQSRVLDETFQDHYKNNIEHLMQPINKNKK